MSLFVIVGLVFASTFLLIFSALYALSLRRDPVKARLEDIASDTDPMARSGYDLKTSLLKKGVEVFTTDVRKLASTKDWLARGGYFGQNAVYEFYLITLMLLISLTVGGALTAFQFHLSMTKVMLAGITGAVLGVMSPRLYVGHQIRKRRDAIRRAVPNMLDLLVVCVEAGLSFTAAIHKLADEMKASCLPLAQELKILTQEILVGKPKAEAFRNLANRTEVDELRSLAVTLIQAERLGTSIATSLRVLADSMRFKRRQRAEEQANKVSVKLVFPLVLLIFPELLIILVGPAMINIFKTLKDVGN